MEHLREFEKKRVVAAEKADLKLDKEATGLSADDARLLANFIKETLGSRVGEVRTSKRLTGSPAVVVDSDQHMTSSMRRMMKMMKPEGAPDMEAAPDFEINPDHAMIGRLEKIRHTDAPLAAQVAEQIYDNALVSAGLLEDPRAMLTRLNSLLERVLT